MGSEDSNSEARTRGANDGFRPDFTQLIQALWLQAMIASGKVMNPITKKYDSDLRMAQYHISLLEVIEAKTTGNLDEAERRILTDLLDQARMAFVDVVARQSAAPPPKAEPPEAQENAAAGDAMENEGSPAPEEAKS